MKHLIIIHGRATKPSGSTKKDLVLKALLHGLERIDVAAAKAVRTDKVKFSFVYYGDVSNREMIKAGSKSKKDLPDTNDAKYEFKPCETADSYNEDLDRLLARSTSAFGKADYKKLLKEHKDKRWLDEAATVTSAVASLFGLNDEVVSRATPDMGAYLMTRKVGSEVRERLAEPLKPALLNGDDVCLVSHSMGCIVSYDVLWKFSQMSEYRAVQNKGNRVSLWLTLGCPLGEPGVIRNLYDANERGEGKYPKNIIKNWLNMAAHDDFVAHDRDVRDDFVDMWRKYRYVAPIKDRRVYNFWVGTQGTNPHKFYGYLDNPQVAAPIAKWIRG